MFKLIKRLIIWILSIVIIAAGTVVYAFYIEPEVLIVKDYQIESSSGQKNTELKVVQLSDIHLSDHYTVGQLDKLVEKVNGLEPDFIVFTGDLIDNYAFFQERKDAAPALKRLEAKYGKYGIWGNHDYGGGAGRVYADIMEEADFRLLKNEGDSVVLENGSRFFIGGVDDGLLGKPDIPKMLDKADNEDFKLVLIHEPDMADGLTGQGVDLILAGHSHGGQVRIPFMDRPTTSMAEKYTNGFYDLGINDKTRLYVNSGVGTTKIPVRFFTPPQIAVFDIQL